MGRSWPSLGQSKLRFVESPASAVPLGTPTGVLHSFKGGGRKAELSPRRVCSRSVNRNMRLCAHRAGRGADRHSNRTQRVSCWPSGEEKPSLRVPSGTGLPPGVGRHSEIPAELRTEKIATRRVAGPVGAAGHANRGFAQPQGGGRKTELSERAGQKTVGVSQGGCVLCLLSVASQKVGAPAARAGERKELYSPREGRAPTGHRTRAADAFVSRRAANDRWAKLGWGGWPGIGQQSGNLHSAGVRESPPPHAARATRRCS